MAQYYASRYVKKYNNDWTIIYEEEEKVDSLVVN
jgi:CTP:phosphocholine cytidylyltransferase-like protein